MKSQNVALGFNIFLAALGFAATMMGIGIDRIFPTLSGYWFLIPGIILFIVGLAGIIWTLIRVRFRKTKINGDNNFNEFNKEKSSLQEFNGINIKELSKWAEGWGSQYTHLNRIVLYAYPRQSELRYDLYFEFDIFSKEGEKQSEVFNEGIWDIECNHFPVHNKIEEFKSVYNEKPKDSDYIDEWNFFCNAREANKEIPPNVPSIEIYKKKPNP